MAQTDVQVRACAEADVPAITAIYRQAVREGVATFEIEPPDAADMLRRRAALLAGGYPYLVATADDVVLGYAYANLYRERPAYRQTVENSVYVRPDAHERGIGRRLLDGLVAAAADAGFRQMVAVIGDSANIGSIRLHAAAGFAHAGVLRDVGWKHGRWLDSVFMQRALGAGAGAPGG